MAINSFAPTASVFLQAFTQSKSVELPTTGTPAAVVVTNVGEQIAFVELGDASVEASQESMAVLPHDKVALTIGSNTWLAAIALNGYTGLNVTVGS